MPGGTAALLRVAGLDPHTPRSLSLPRLIRAVFSTPVGVDRAIDARRARIAEYLQTLSDYERARAALPSTGISLTQTSISRNALNDFADSAGGRIERDRTRLTFVLVSDDREARRRRWLKEAGLDVENLGVELNAGRVVGALLAAEEVPSPLGDDRWRALLDVKPGPAGVLFAAILTDRRASLLWCGLLSAGESVRNLVNARPDMFDEIYRSDRAAVLASVGRSVKITGGRVDVPGGPAALPLWESLVDERVARPDRFLLKLLDRDDGRMAAFYDAIAHFDAPRQAFALGADASSRGDRLDRFRALYAATLRTNQGVNPTDRPFSLNLYDMAHLFLLTRFDANGHLQGPAWRTFWDTVLASDEIPEWPAREVRDIERDGVLDATDLVELISVANTSGRRQRAETWLFAQRVFANAQPADLPDILTALRGFQRFNALVLTIERMGVTDPAVYADAVIRARNVTGANALALFQGSVAMLDRARRGQAISAVTAGKLLTSLSNVQLAPDGRALGAVARWIAHDWLPVLGPPPTTMAIAPAGDDAPIEHQVLRAFAGQISTRASGPAPVVEIEGLRYSVDPAAAEERRLVAIRKAQGGPTLDQILAFSREVDALEAGVATPALLIERMSAFAAAARLLPIERPARPTAAGEPPRVREQVADALQRLEKIQKSRKLKDVPGVVRRLQPAVDYFLAQVLIALAYAPNLDEATGRALRGGDPSLHHDWMAAESLERDRILGPWRLPLSSHDGAGTWRVSGALLGLDHGLRDLELRRVSTESLPEPPTITNNDRAAFTEVASLSNPLDYVDKDRDQIASALRRGRDILASIAADPGRLAGAITAAGISDARREVLPWALANEPDRLPDLFTLAELLRLGRLEIASIERFDAWGTSGYSAEGCLCLKFPQSGEWLTGSARFGKGVAASLMPDLTLVVGEWLAEHQLPAALTPSILAVATQDFEDDLRLAFDDDWLAMSWQARKTVQPRMDDYVASLTVRGPLVAIR
ncbi:MAG: hypothetical protein NTV05_05970 [Acidobacteria bacterium]|nr:hypothetical protein [Acidobacteriota bacterium]